MGVYEKLPSAFVKTEKIVASRLQDMARDGVLVNKN